MAPCTMHHQNELVMTKPVRLYDAWCHSLTHLIFNIPQYRPCCMKTLETSCIYEILIDILPDLIANLHICI